jgi:hypothetical protein
MLARKAPASGWVPTFAKATAGGQPGLISCKHLSCPKICWVKDELCRRRIRRSRRHAVLHPTRDLSENAFFHYKLLDIKKSTIDNGHELY